MSTSFDIQFCHPLHFRKCCSGLLILVVKTAWHFGDRTASLQSLLIPKGHKGLQPLYSEYVIWVIYNLSRNYILIRKGYISTSVLEQTVQLSNPQIQQNSWANIAQVIGLLDLLSLRMFILMVSQQQWTNMLQNIFLYNAVPAALQ